MEIKIEFNPFENCQLTYKLKSCKKQKNKQKKTRKSPSSTHSTAELL